MHSPLSRITLRILSTWDLSALSGIFQEKPFGFPHARRFYAALRAILGGLADASKEGVVKSGLLTVDPGIECFVLVIEDHGGDHLTVYIPGSPNPGSGSVQVVRRHLVRMLNVRMTDVTAVLHQFGMGSAKVLAKHNAATPGDPHPSGTL